jgi:DNA-binding CsgD family transcriptional regulator
MELNMRNRQRNCPARPLTSEQLLDVLDRIYDLEAAELDWLRGIGEAIRPLVDHGAGVTVHRLVLPSHPTAGGQMMILGLGNDAETMWARFSRKVPLEILSDRSMTAPLSNAALCSTPRVRSYAAAGHAAMGVHSHTAINATDLEHRVVAIGIPAPVGGCVFWPERGRDSWERISAHLGAAFRLRNAGAARGAPSLVVDKCGRTQHVAPDLGGANLSRLRAAIATVDRARRVRMSPEAVLDAWRALYEARWSIVESTERDGRRLLIARPNVPVPDQDSSASTPSASPRRPGPPRPLSAQERRVLIALAKGHSNKLIAYELGLATSTVGTLLARAANKLGCRNRIALARAGRALTEQPGTGLGAEAGV